MVWSRCGRRLPLQPSISRSTSDSIRYSRVRTSAFLGRRGVTFRISVVGGTILKTGFAISFWALAGMTFCKVVKKRKVSKRCLVALYGVSARRRTDDALAAIAAAGLTSFKLRLLT